MGSDAEVLTAGDDHSWAGQRFQHHGGGGVERGLDLLPLGPFPSWDTVLEYCSLWSVLIL